MNVFHYSAKDKNAKILASAVIAEKNGKVLLKVDGQARFQEKAKIGMIFEAFKPLRTSGKRTNLSRKMRKVLRNQSNRLRLQSDKGKALWF